MGCNCKAIQQVDYIHKKYGVKTPASKSTQIKLKVKTFFKKIGFVILVIPFVPIMLIHMLFTNIVKKQNKINIGKLFNLEK